VINGLALQSALEEKKGIQTRLTICHIIKFNEVAEPFILACAPCRHLEKGGSVIFGDGTGNPLILPTDSVACIACQYEI